MKRKINEFMAQSWCEIENRLKHLCRRPSPAKRLVVVLAAFVMLAAVNIWFVASSIYSIGKNDAQKEFIRLQHIETLELQKKDSINNLKNQKDDR